MSWYYRARRREDKGEVFYDVVEYYPPHPDGIHGETWTVRCSTPYGETKEELIAELERMMNDVKTRPVIDETEKP